jgi:biopolymer transport protein ExbB
MTQRRSLVPCLAALLLVLPGVAHAWWNKDWAFRKEIVFDLSPAGADIAGNPTDVPLLVRLHAGNFGYFADTLPNGEDLRFVAGDDVTPLPFHIERYDAANQMAFVWVKVPRLTGGSSNDKIYLYYGNPKAEAGADRPKTYDPQQVLVYHFSAADGSIDDSTAYKNAPTRTLAGVNPASLIAGGFRFDGKGSFGVDGSATLRVPAGQGATISTWLRLEQPQGDAWIAAFEDGERQLVLGVRGLVPYARLVNDGQTTEVPAANELSAAAWHHVAIRAGDGRLALLVDGQDAGSVDVEVPELGGSFSAGGSAAGANPLTAAEIDELQVATAARSADWLKAAARSQGLEPTLISYGADAQQESGDVSYFAVTLRNVTLDGWVIIGILAVMFVFSVIVMFGKALFLRRVERENTQFLQDYRKLTDDPRALDHEVSDEAEEALDESPTLATLTAPKGEYTVSTLFRLYHVAMQELNKRLPRGAVGARNATVLSSQSIEAIKAAMDGTKARLSQRLSAQMVLLTISIAGGPFLGLLGTVVGVMITFAAIAASGEVNVNAIAPGTAAALVATVAGLAVAIPCLFGYNWLNSRIKNINTDDTVFIDEMVTMLAERYS